MEMTKPETAAAKRQAWNAGRTVGAKRALKPKQIWQIGFYLNQNGRLRDRALFDLAIDSKLRGCDLVRLKIGGIVSGGQIRTRAIMIQQKTGRPATCAPSRFSSAAARSKTPCAISGSTWKTHLPWPKTQRFE